MTFVLFTFLCGYLAVSFLIWLFEVILSIHFTFWAGVGLYFLICILSAIVSLSSGHKKGENK